MTDKVLLEAKHIKQYFPAGGFGKNKKYLKAVDDISIELHEGETLALVGESGCGKTTLAKSMIYAIEPTEGEVLFEGEPLTKDTLDKHVVDMQMIFQDPLSSLNPRMTVFDIIAEPMRVCHTCSEKDMKERVYKLMDMVGLRRDVVFRYPHEFSGGQCQRIGIARALALNPKLIVCDEPVSALDVSIKAQIINMFADIQKETNVAYLFITHDLLTVRYVSHRVAVMYLGHLVELAETEELFKHPKHPYTRALLSAISVPDVDAKVKRIPIKGEVPSPLRVPTGCPFRTRCNHFKPECYEKMPDMQDVGNGHYVACTLIRSYK